MDEHEEDPLDLLEDDGDGMIETILFFDEDENKQKQTPQGTGCGVILLLLGSGIFASGFYIFARIIA
ncbi:hypothetical protein ACFL0S_00615 [Thermodesulfobacteriota bacterium]